MKRDGNNERTTTYALLHVTFGDKPSPDMASFVVLKMAEHKEVAPEAFRDHRKRLIHRRPRSVMPIDE